MIEPLEPGTNFPKGGVNIVVKKGKSTASILFDENGVKAKMNNPTPKFTHEVGQFIDTFMFSGDKSQEALNEFAIDTFEKGNSNVHTRKEAKGSREGIL